MSVGSNNVSINDLSIGVNSIGMSNYRDDLRLQVIEETIKLIDDVDDLENTISSGWQGVSRDKFLKIFKETREKIKEDLQLEYDDLDARLYELEANYYMQDESLIQE